MSEVKSLTHARRAIIQLNERDLADHFDDFYVGEDVEGIFIESVEWNPKRRVLNIYIGGAGETSEYPDSEPRHLGRRER